MKIVVTGALGHISKPLVGSLVADGHQVTVISRNPDNQAAIEQLGATAVIGSVEDVDFLTKVFSGAAAVYTMVPPNNYFDHSLNLLEYYRRLGRNYAAAIAASGVKRVVNLSSIGAHLEKGNGILVGANNVEQLLNALPKEVAITHMRPTSFYYNLFPYIHMIKRDGRITANYAGTDLVPWVSPNDIAAAIAEELVKPFSGRDIRYVASEEVTCDDTAATLGAAIGLPDLRWELVSDEAVIAALTGIGMNPEIAAGLVEMYAALHSGLLAEDYHLHKPKQLGQVKLKDFAREFAAAYAEN
ncbi:NAD(P)H-binding protein [Chitinophaga sp. sic0106]|uniref:NAD(P)H-binding protein n=1 Tax=Chitinophaga sp. sic0106 TaxID=2854785 RepID=UPI001C468988|nr:NAD(P)H-binding protein [Chitinophaga sp. sic0106]MBV7530693.1 NAD(P)H-binding protein [Chitinophaga sp. sic0106]